MEERGGVSGGKGGLADKIVIKIAFKGKVKFDENFSLLQNNSVYLDFKDGYFQMSNIT